MNDIDKYKKILGEKAQFLCENELHTIISALIQLAEINYDIIKKLEANNLKINNNEDSSDIQPCVHGRAA